MSRGPGRWQRVVLAALDAHWAVYLVDLLPPDATRAQYVALHRAACRLADAGRIGYLTYRATRRKEGYAKVVVRRLDDPPQGTEVRRCADEARQAVRDGAYWRDSLSVDKVVTFHLVNT